ncbi:unnamed protein product [Musa hybrid cultivar]
MAGGFRVLHLVRPFLAFLPEVQSADRKIPFREKVIYTVISLFIFLVCSQLPLYRLWDRFPTARTVQQMMETMEIIMDDPLGYSVTSSPSLGGEEFGGGYRRGRTPWEIKEGEGVYKMRFDMPGMTKNDVKVWVEERMLVIKAEKLPKEIKEGEEEEWSAKSYGRYNSRIALPDTIDLEKIKAEVKDGVLYVTIPKASPSSKVVDISVQ